jgi:hypothetical protein
MSVGVVVEAVAAEVVLVLVLAVVDEAVAAVVTV